MFNLSETCFKIKRSGCSNHKNRAINKIGEIIIYVQIFFYSRMLYCFILDLRKRKLIQDTRFTFYVSNHLSKSFIRTERYDHHETPRWKKYLFREMRHMWNIFLPYFDIYILELYQTSNVNIFNDFLGNNNNPTITDIHINHIVSFLYSTLIFLIKIYLQSICQYQLKNETFYYWSFCV